MENLPDARALIRMGREMVQFCCQSFARAPSRIVLDIDDTFDAVHGHQQLRLFNVFYDEFGLIVVLPAALIIKAMPVHKLKLTSNSSSILVKREAVPLFIIARSLYRVNL